MTNILAPFLNVDNQRDGIGGVTELKTATDVIGVTIGNKSFVYAAGRNDNGVQVFSFAGGMLSAQSALVDNGTNDITSPEDLEHVSLGGRNYLLIKGFTSITVALIDDLTGALTVTDTVSDTASSVLRGFSNLETISIGVTTYVYVASLAEDAITAFSMDPVTGALSEVDRVTDADDVAYTLDGVRNLHTATIGARSFLFTASKYDNGVSVFEINSDGTLTARDHVTDSGALELNNAMGLATAEIGGTTYLYVGGHGDHGISVFSVAADGSLSNAFNYHFGTSVQVGLWNPGQFQMLQYGDATVLIATALTGDSLVAFSVEDDGSLTEIGRMLDNGTTNLNGTFRVSKLSVGNTDYLLANGFGDNGISVFEVGGGDDVLSGTNGDDRIFGFDGDDVLVGKSGADHLFGGANADVLVGHGGKDKMRGGSGGDILDGRSGVDTAEYIGSGAGVSVNLLSGAVSGGHARGDILIDIENLTGSKHADNLTGDGGNNLLRGKGGADSIDGGDGVDRVYGNAGDDLLRGGLGDDKLYGGSGTNTMQGGAGNDLLTGKAGIDDAQGGGGSDVIATGAKSDRLSGGAGADSLNGGAGNDLLAGGSGADRMKGGAGNDVFMFTDGSGSGDVITDFTDGADKIDLSGHSGANGFSDISIIALGGDLIVQFGTSGDEVLLKNFTAAQLGNEDFIF